MLPAADIGVISALPVEFAAMRALLDKPRDHHLPGQGAARAYVVGTVPSSNGRGHRVALALLPDVGNNQASARAALLMEHFPTIRDIIVVGIAGCAPDPASPAEHVRLGDIIVSDRTGVIQYDFRCTLPNGVIPRFAPRPPSARLLESARRLQAGELTGARPWLRHIRRVRRVLKTRRPQGDVLHDAINPAIVVAHPSDPLRREDEPRVFIGPIASANTLLRDPIARDVLRKQYGVKAIEMEGSGAADASWMRTVGVFVVRGAVDYCDSYKNDDWHAYGALVAAAYVRAVLGSTANDLPAAPPPARRRWTRWPLIGAASLLLLLAALILLRRPDVQSDPPRLISTPLLLPVALRDGAGRSDLDWTVTLKNVDTAPLRSIMVEQRFYVRTSGAESLEELVVWRNDAIHELAPTATADFPVKMPAILRNLGLPDQGREALFCIRKYYVRSSAASFAREEDLFVLLPGATSFVNAAEYVVSTFNPRDGTVSQKWTDPRIQAIVGWQLTMERKEPRLDHAYGLGVQGKGLPSLPADSGAGSARSPALQVSPRLLRIPIGQSEQERFRIRVQNTSSSRQTGRIVGVEVRPPLVRPIDFIVSPLGERHVAMTRDIEVNLQGVVSQWTDSRRTIVFVPLEVLDAREVVELEATVAVAAFDSDIEVRTGEADPDAFSHRVLPARAFLVLSPAGVPAYLDLKKALHSYREDSGQIDFRLPGSGWLRNEGRARDLLPALDEAGFHLRVSQRKDGVLRIEFGTPTLARGEMLFYRLGEVDARRPEHLLSVKWNRSGEIASIDGLSASPIGDIGLSENEQPP